MAQIVHDLAPGASIAFASAFSGEEEFAANIRRLAAAGAKVIADDVGYFEEPFFQDGPVAVAVDEVENGGVSYFSAVGNDNLLDGAGRDIASWEAPAFRDSAGCPVKLLLIPGFGPGHCMDFDPATATADDSFGLTVAKAATLTVDLQWAEPWNGVGTDLDAFLLDSAGNPLKVKVGSSEFLVGSVDDNLASQRPVEVLQWKNTTGAAAEVQLAINNCFAACNPEAGGGSPRLKFILLENGSGVTATEYPESSEGDVVGPAVFGHSGSAAAIGVGAVRYSDNAALERFSSRGPVKHYFGPVSGSSAAAATGERLISKPDLAATDGAANTFFGSLVSGTWRFFGTSAAAPHAAAVAALVRQGNPGAGPDQVRAALSATARPVGAFGPSAVGAGLVDAYGAVRALALPPVVTITRAPEALGRIRQPAIEFAANRPVAFSCEIDGAAAAPCASPFVVPSPFADGRHAVLVRGVDVAGRAGSASAAFAVDATAPRTRIARHPAKLLRTHRRAVRAAFRFASSEPGSSFLCGVDRQPPRVCARKISRRFREGRHLIRVRARDRAGNVDPSPAAFRFRVERIG